MRKGTPPSTRRSSQDIPLDRTDSRPDSSSVVGDADQVWMCGRLSVARGKFGCLQCTSVMRGVSVNAVFSSAAFDERHRDVWWSRVGPLQPLCICQFCRSSHAQGRSTVNRQRRNLLPVEQRSGPRPKRSGEPASG